MSENHVLPWPDNWVELTCPNGHVLKHYSEINEGRVYGFCDTCGLPYCFSYVPIDRAPSRVMLPPEDYDVVGKVDLPPYPTG